MKRIELKIHTWPDKILSTKCKEVKAIDASIRQIFDEMLILMRAVKGIGLAANQVGINLRLAVMEAADRVFKIANPKIIKKEGKAKILEGCLSLPGLELEIKRANRLWVSGLDEKGEPLDLEVSATLAIIFQHEIDHLNGLLIIDRIPFWQRLKITPQLRKIKKIKKYGMSEQAKKS
jgi:peptide deformylase